MLSRLHRWVSALVRRVSWWLQSSTVHHYVVRLVGGETRTVGRVITHRIVGEHLELVDLDGALYLVRLDCVDSVRPAASFTAHNLVPRRAHA